MSLSKRYQYNTRSNNKALNLCNVSGLIHTANPSLPPIRDNLEFFGDLLSSRTVITSGAVSTYGDSSGNNRDLLQTISANRPTYNSSDVNFKGRNSMTLDGVNDFMSLAAGLPNLSEITYILVVRAFTTAGFTRIITINDGFNAIDGTSGVHMAGVFGASQVTVGRFEHTANIISTQNMLVPTTPPSRIAYSGKLSQGGDMWTTYVNGVSSISSKVTNTLSGGATSNTGPLVLGASKTGTLPAGYTVTDVLIYSKALSQDEITVIDNWLALRNGF